MIFPFFIERFQWTSQTTQLLLEEIKNNFSSIHNKNYLQKKIWKKIANIFNKKGYLITDEQCSTKWKNLKQKYKAMKDKKKKTGQGKKSWEYYDTIDSFFNISPEIEPSSVASSTHGFRTRQPSPDIEINCDDENNSALCNTSDKLTCNIRRRKNYNANWLEKLYKQRKHYNKQNIKMQERFLTLFEKYIQERRQRTVNKIYILFCFYCFVS